MITKKHIKYSTTNWADIETLLFDFFKGEHNFDKILKIKNPANNYNDILKQIKFLDQIEIVDNISNNINEKSKIIEKNFYLQLLVYKFILNQNKIVNTEKYYEYLLSELNKFEKNFSNYLITNLDVSNYIKENKNTDKIYHYIVNSDKSRDYLINYILEDVNNKKFNLLNFNYDNFKSDYVSKINHIHGSINSSDKKPIIIGFDSSNVLPNEPYYRFTKASRIMEESVIKSEKILDKNIKNIYFYGHSLAAADNSYFNAIFDYYDLYNKDINLVFCYTPYGNNEEENKKIKSNQMNSINNLIFNYGNTLNNTHGGNILPKLLLENRLHLKEIPKIYS